MKKIKVLMILLLIAVIAKAQDEKDQTEYSHKGYYNSTNFGVLVGSKDNQNSAPFSFMMVNGYGITDQIALGLGVGVNFLSESYLPLVLDARYYFWKQKFSPYAFIQGGYSIPLDDETYQEYNFLSALSYWSGYDPLKPKGGFLFNPGIGLKTMFSNNLGVSFSIGYHFQRLSYDRAVGDRDTELEIDMNRMEIKVGIFFK